MRELATIDAALRHTCAAAKRANADNRVADVAEHLLRVEDLLEERAAATAPPVPA